jgi:hypothetical protein
MRRISVTITVITLAAGLAACGSSSKSGISPLGGGSNTTAKSGSTGNGDLDALLAKAKSANVKVTYKSNDKNSDFTLVQYHGDSALISGESEFVTTGGKSYTCQLGSTPTCTEMPAGQNIGQAMTSSFFGIYSALFASTGSFSALGASVSKSTSSDTIAGRDAKCEKVSGSAGGQSGSITACIDSKTGVFLKGSTTTNGGAASSIEATAFADSTADDLKLPATPTSLGGIGTVPTT